MPSFDITVLRVDRDEDPTVVEALYLTVEWPWMPREGEGLDITKDLAQTVESVGYGLDGHPTVFIGRVVLDDLQAAQLRKVGWRTTTVRSDRA